MNESDHRLALPQGTRIQDFEFHRVLGQGGFGITYLCWNMALDIPVAIKEYLPSNLATRESDLSVVPQSSQAASDFAWGLDRFLKEARTLAQFDHRHIIKVYHFFEAHGTAYIVMEYAEGETLSEFLKHRGTLTEYELKAILYPLLDGLEGVHSADFLHRDIKPLNIIIRDEDASPVLLDFGAARQATGVKSQLSEIYTDGYAPIEQYSSRGIQGAWTDIYALGVVCYRALTGDVPANATDRVIQDTLLPVVDRCAGQASREFLSGIDWALQVRWEDRPQSIAKWRDALGRKTPPPPPLPPSEEKGQDKIEDQSDAHKKPKGKLFAVVACLLVVLIGGISYYQYETERVLRDKMPSDPPLPGTEHILLAEFHQQSESWLIQPISEAPFRLGYSKNYRDEEGYNDNQVLQITLGSNKFNIERPNDVASFVACKFFANHHFQFYSINASRGVSNVYNHYFIRRNDKFQYMGIFPDLHYSKELKLLVGSEKHGPGMYQSTYLDPKTGRKVYPESADE